jgi:flagellar hook-associated protein 1 FlgK
MTLSAALTAASSGLRASSMGARVVADNIANAQTDGFGPRALQLSAHVLGRDGVGVRVAGVTRSVDQQTIDLLRDARSSAAGAETLSRFQSGLERLTGQPGDAAGLTARLDAFETSLRNALAYPSSDLHLSAIARAGADLAQTIRETGIGIDRLRDDADAAIANDVRHLQSELTEIARLQVQIVRAASVGHPTEALEDQRTARIDAISEMMPVRDVRAPDGRLMLLGADGTVLADRQAAQITFTRSVAPQADETLASGDLSHIAINGRIVAAQSDLLATGRIGRHFAIRDDLTLQAREQIDQLAHDLTVRMSDPAADPSLDGTGYGVYRLNGVAPWPNDIRGIANLISLDPRLTPDGGMQVWRLRDGMETGAPNAPNQTSVLLSRLQSLRGADQAMMIPTALQNRSIGNLAQNLVAQVSQSRVLAEDRLTLENGRLTAMKEVRAGQGVDRDAQLQILMGIEQSFAANARVIAAVDGLLRLLLEMR